MAKIILTSRYLKGKEKSSKGNFINYIATREGVDVSADVRFKNNPATKKQNQKIDELVKIIPDIKNCLEYADYKNNPTTGNASELITEAIENNLDIFADKGILINYMALRPRAEKVHGHGLFSASDKPIDLEKVKNEIANHKGNIYTNVISLRREDAERLGYNNAEAWRALIKSKQMAISKNMKIPLEDLRWYAGFHNESHHPHVHLVIYNANPKNEFLTEKGIENLRSEFGNEIFKNELLNIYEQKTVLRNALTEKSKEELKFNDNPKLELMLLNLSEKLKTHKGKKQYGYLRPDVKKAVNDIVKELAADSRIQEFYKHWCELQDEIVSLYKKDLPEPPPLWEQKEFKAIKNAVIAEALKISDDGFNFEQGSEYIPQDLAETEKWSEQERKTDIHDDVNNYSGQPIAVSILNLFRHLEKIIEDDYNLKFKKDFARIDRKQMKKEMEKKIAQGQKFE